MKTSLKERYIFGAKFNWKRRWKFWREYPLGVCETLWDACKSLGLVLFIPIVPFLHLGLLIWRLTIQPLWAAHRNAEEVESLIEVMSRRK